jgi:glycolate oxidase FAD binding subunit
MSTTQACTVLKPRDVADVAAIVAARTTALEIVGLGSKRAVGRPLTADVLDLSALRGIVAYEPAELVLSARAATPLAEIESALAASAQRLAFEPPDLGVLLGDVRAQTLGGVIAANLAGSRRVSAGAARDHFLGFGAVAGSGEPFKAGGKVVKNVTGYDLPKLMAGSWGTLAVLTEITVRVAPVPEVDRTLVFAPTSIASDAALLRAALASAHDVAAAGLDPARGSLLRLEGFAPSVEVRTAALCAEIGREPSTLLEGTASRELWHAHGSATSLAAFPVVWRLSVAPTEAAAVLERIAPEAYLLDWGGGLIWAACASVDVARVRAAFSAGHATLVKAPREERARSGAFQPPAPVAAAAAARLKRAFDPREILNPGRMD